MSKFTSRAAIGTFVSTLFLAAAATSDADIVVLRSGAPLPASAKLEPATGVPSSEEIESSKGAGSDLAYDVVKVGGKEVSAALVVDVYCTEAIRNTNYNEAESRADSKHWNYAAESFAAAAEDLKGSAKQMAMYMRVECLANENDIDGTLQAADDLLTQFPKSFWFGPVQIRRALVFASKGKMDDATAALKKVTDAPGMNARDYFEAEYTRVWLTQMASAQTGSQWATVEKSFRDVVSAIDSNPKGKAEAADQRLKVSARVGKALAMQGKAKEARTLLEPLVNTADKSTHKAALAAAYAGLGDAYFTDAKAALEGGKKDEALKLSDEALLAYLRVKELYPDFADTSDVFNATQNGARVFRNLFGLNGMKNCDDARRAYEFFHQAVRMLDSGRDKEALVREAKQLMEDMKKPCEEPQKAAAAPADGGTPPK